MGGTMTDPLPAFLRDALERHGYDPNGVQAWERTDAGYRVRMAPTADRVAITITRVSLEAAGSPPAPMPGPSEGNPMPKDPAAPSGPVVGCLAVHHNRVDCRHLPHSERCPVCKEVR
jgi:hypothetical protein